MQKLFLSLGLAVCLVACNGNDAQKADKAVPGTGTPVSEALKKPLDQARQTEQQVFDSAEQQKKRADEL